MNICIIGLGLIGGTYAHALRNNKKIEKITAVDIDRDSLCYALSNGIIDEGACSAEGFLPQADLVIFCLYPKLMKSFLVDNRQYFKKGAIITDAVGIKSKLISDLKEYVPEDVDFIFGHPMAGREKTGVRFAEASIFKGANYILTPTDRNKKENIEILKGLIEDMGFKSVNCLKPEEHDEIISFTSQLTHAIAVALVNSDNEKFDTNCFIGDSYRDLTRIAKINSKLWTELFLENKYNLIDKIDAFQNTLNEIKEALINEDVDCLERNFRKSTERREKID